ncbi:hypothetical protein Ae201684P_012586 [Aphanomyces euteiches]|uniref:Uncharacterized protein n=1 Tax=Aphanomyces euteiches TaxID=100861 RepID=A0A6G0WBJ5_9STRA|nr:hypothetical protein Ae201684_016838 [Aphanomyces euteiches]KAH9076096.1 hypothetical protein Ae201684P_012586 [Aphanomyces euteiches]KAH9152326.1 hypothetical protein AeRB84_005226 [Aphanomyces euteiches]
MKATTHDKGWQTLVVVSFVLSLVLLVAVQMTLTMLGWTEYRFLFVSVFGLTDTGLYTLPWLLGIFYWLLHHLTTEDPVRRHGRSRFIAKGRHGRY